jgi:hypothetical protein
VIDMALLSVIRRWHFREGMPNRQQAIRFNRSFNRFHHQSRNKANPAGPGIAISITYGDFGAGEGNRTLDNQLGKLMFYH